MTEILLWKFYCNDLQLICQKFNQSCQSLYLKNTYTQNWWLKLQIRKAFCWYIHIWTSSQNNPTSITILVHWIFFLMNIGNNMVSIHFFTGCQGVLPWMAATSHHGFIPGPQTRRVGSPVMEPIVKNACGEWSGNWLSIQAIVKQRVKWVILSCFSLFVPALHIFASLMFFIFQNNLPRTAHLYCQTSLFCALESSSPAWCNQPPLTALGDVNRSSTSLGSFQCCFGKDLEWSLSQSPHKSDAALLCFALEILALQFQGTI